MSLKLTRESLNARISETGILCLDKVENSRTKLRFQCLNRHIWTTVSRSVLVGRGCNVCSINQPLPSQYVGLCKKLL